MRPKPSLCTAAALTFAWSGSLHGETLAEAVALAYRSNPTLQAGRYDLRAADETIVQARAELRPTLDLQVTGTYTRTVQGRAERDANPFASLELAPAPTAVFIDGRPQSLESRQRLLRDRYLTPGEGALPKAYER